MSSAFLLFAGYFSAVGKQGDMTWLPSFLATMLCGGRAVGFLLRCKKEPEIRTPAVLVLSAALVSVAGTLAAYWTTR